MKISIKIIFSFLIIFLYYNSYAGVCVPPKNSVRNSIFLNVVNNIYYKSDNGFIDFFIDKPFFKTNLFKKISYSIGYENCLEIDEGINKEQLINMKEISYKDLYGYKQIIILNFLSLLSIILIFILIILRLFFRKNIN